MRRWSAVVAVLLALASAGGMAGCSSRSGASGDEPPSPFAACPASVESSTGDLGGITLPCFTGGAPVHLTGLGQPAVINVWASWCLPCRTELPEVQKFATEANGQLLVLGVIHNDTRSAAAWAGTDYGVTFPAVFDSSGTVAAHLGRTAIPMTIFVNADGSVAHVEQAAGPLTEPDLRRLAHDTLGVTLP